MLIYARSITAENSAGSWYTACSSICAGEPSLSSPEGFTGGVRLRSCSLLLSYWAPTEKVPISWRQSQGPSPSGFLSLPHSLYYPVVGNASFITPQASFLPALSCPLEKPDAYPLGLSSNSSTGLPEWPKKRWPLLDGVLSPPDLHCCTDTLNPNDPFPCL